MKVKIYFEIRCNEKQFFALLAFSADAVQIYLQNSNIIIGLGAGSTEFFFLTIEILQYTVFRFLNEILKEDLTFLEYFLHLHEIVEGLYFHCSLSVCLSVCVCVSGCILVNKIPAERMHRFGRGFRQMVASCIGSNAIEFGDLGSKVKVTVTENVSKIDE